MRFCDIPSFVTTPPLAGLPRVRFLCGAVEVIKRERWMFKASGGLYLSRQQLPLKLAWAISIHKSQVSSALMSHHESFCIGSKLLSQTCINWLHRMKSNFTKLCRWSRTVLSPRGNYHVISLKMLLKWNDLAPEESVLCICEQMLRAMVLVCVLTH